MPTGFGYSGICGVVEESVWGTPLAVTQRVPFLSESVSDSFTLLPDETLEGVAAMRAADQGVQTVQGTIVAHLRYRTSELFLKHFFGTLSVGAYTMNETLEDKGLTLAIEKGVSVWEIQGAKVMQWELTGSPSQQIRTSYTIVGQTVDRASGVNTSGVLAALTDTATNMLFTDLVFRIGDQVDALAAGDNMGISEFTLRVTRPMATDYTNQQRTVIQPLENGRRECTLSFTIPRYTANTFKTWADASTKLQASFTFTSGGSSKTLILPEIKLATVESPISGPELLPVQVEAVCYRNISNAFMSTGAKELQLNEA